MILTQNRMQDIDNAIVQYLNVNGMLPCPAKLNDTPDTATFGRSITDGLPNSPDCFATSATPGTYATTGYLLPANLQTTNKTGNIIMGAVPIRSLNLPDQEMADAWGDRFVYTVTDALTAPATYDPTQGSILVVDSNNNKKVGPNPNPLAPQTYAQYVIVGYGADRAGAYTISGVKAGTACPASGPETNNCTYPSRTYTQTMLTSYQSGTGYFDDYVTYHSQMNSTGTVPSGTVAPYIGGVNCPPGWGQFTNYDCSASFTTPHHLCCQKQ
jgi:hypothetical protein